MRVAQVTLDLRAPAFTRLAVLLIALAVLRIVPTYRTFAATADEPTHVGAGLELWQLHRYRLQPVNPPAARLVLAAAPALGGMRYTPMGDYGGSLHTVFYGAGDYKRNLFLSRAGNAVFLVLAAIAVFVLMRREAGDLAALIALFLFTFEPVILGHSALATNDAAAAASLALALLAFGRWLRGPTSANAAIVAAAWALAILCKFSNIAFVPLSCLGIGMVRVVADGQSRSSIIRRAPLLLLVPPIAALLVWAGYGFSMGTLGDLHDVRDVFGGTLEQLIVAHPSIPLPAPLFFIGVGYIRRFDTVGHMSYFRGEASLEGWPLYFPATIVLKTTLVVLLFIAAGFWFARRTPVLRRLMIEFLSASLLLLAFSSRSRLDLGIRYVLPVLVPLTLAAAAGAAAMLRSGRAPAIAAGLLLAWHGVASIRAHPDYFPYFNALAGSDPSRIVIDSNLDWGQDVLRLRGALRREHADQVSLSLMGGADYDALGFPTHYRLDAQSRATGWIAVSDHVLRMDGAVFGGWRWLENQPFRRVGKSIRLYHLTSPPGDGMATILLPLAGTRDDVQFPLGPRWRIRQQVTNTAPRAVHIETNACTRAALCAFDLAGGRTVSILTTYGRPWYVTLRAPRAASDLLRTTTFVERTDSGARGFRLSIPDVRDSELAAKSIVIPNVTVSPAARLNLRAWAPPGSPLTVAFARAGVIFAQRSFTARPDGYFTVGDLAHELPELAGRDLTGEVSVTLEGDDRLWAFITATDNQTNLPRLLLPPS